MRQITTVQPVSLPEKIEIIAQCLQPVRRDVLMPVVIFDDTDRWSTPAENRIVDGFFGQAIRWLTDLQVSLVVATHSHYIESRAGGATLLTFLDTKVALPRLPSADQLARILHERVRVHIENAGSDPAPPSLAEVVTASAVGELFKKYESGSSLRRVLQLAHIALGEAADAGAEVVSEHHIAAAAQA